QARVGVADLDPVNAQRHEEVRKVAKPSESGKGTDAPERRGFEHNDRPGHVGHRATQAGCQDAFRGYAGGTGLNGRRAVCRGSGGPLACCRSRRHEPVTRVRQDCVSMPEARMMHGVRILAAFLSSVSRRTIPPGGRLAPGTARPHWLPGRLRAAGAAAVLALALADAIGAQQAGPPVTQVPPARAAAWTPSADAPEGLLTPLEGQRHDRFIEQARAGGIDLVFFGSTETEM